MNNLEEIVSLSLLAFDKVSVDRSERDFFELQFRRLMMQKYCNKTQTSTHVNSPGTLYGTWSGLHPNTKTLLNG